MKYKIFDKDSGNFICMAEIADNFLKRAIGLMFRPAIKEEEGLLILFPQYLKSTAIHSFFMFFSIDLIFLDSRNEVVDIHKLKPWGVYSPGVNVAAVLELKEGTASAKNIGLGSQLEIK